MQYFITCTGKNDLQTSFYNQLFDSYNAAKKKIEEWNKIQSNVFFMILPYYVNPFYNFDYIHNQWLSFNHYFRKGA